MVIRNSKQVDAENGRFTVLDMVTLQLSGPFVWQGKDINEDKARGSAFFAFEPDDPNETKVSVATITVADVTLDPSEPDVSTLNQTDVSTIDTYLRSEIQKQVSLAGDEIGQWMGSHLNQSEQIKGLVTAYTLQEFEKVTQYIDLRITIGGRKLFLNGNFDISKKDQLAGLVYCVLRNVVVDLR